MQEPNIKIGVLSNKEIRFDLYGEFSSSSFEKKLSGRFSVQLIDEKLVLYQDSKELISVKELIFTPYDIETESFLLYDVVIGKDFHWERKEKQRFRGSLHIIIEGNNLTAINILPLEEYLVSVISSEMSPNSSPELLKAHAVVSRSWLLAQLEKQKIVKNKKSVKEIITDDEITRWYDREDHTNYDFCADDHCQRYQGVTKIINENALRAIESTNGLVLLYNNLICDTRYSKCCGGMTEAFENVWELEKHPYLEPSFDYKFELDGLDYDLTNNKHAERWINTNPHAYCNTSNQRVLSQILVDFDRPTNDFFRWSVKYTQDELSDLIGNKSKIDFGEIVDLIPIERGYSGRITRLKIVGTKRTLIIGKELEIRRMLSKSHLYSSAFYVEKENIENNIPKNFTIHGAGWGHGVGLCQIGAALMGEKGYNFDEILVHYFHNAKIQKIY